MTQVLAGYAGERWGEQGTFFFSEKAPSSPACHLTASRGQMQLVTHVTEGLGAEWRESRSKWGTRGRWENIQRPQGGRVQWLRLWGDREAQTERGRCRALSTILPATANGASQRASVPWPCVVEPAGWVTLGDVLLCSSSLLLSETVTRSPALLAPVSLKTQKRLL